MMSQREVGVGPGVLGLQVRREDAQRLPIDVVDDGGQEEQSADVPAQARRGEGHGVRRVTYPSCHPVCSIDLGRARTTFAIDCSHEHVFPARGVAPRSRRGLSGRAAAGRARADAGARGRRGDPRAARGRRDLGHARRRRLDRLPRAAPRRRPRSAVHLRPRPGPVRAADRLHEGRRRSRGSAGRGRRARRPGPQRHHRGARPGARPRRCRSWPRRAPSAASSCRRPSSACSSTAPSTARATPAR